MATAALVFAFAGCAVHDVQRGASLRREERWVLLPLQNLAETPMAGERAEAILATLLRMRGLASLEQYPGDDQAVPDIDERRRSLRAITWAKSQGYTYGVTGSVNEWRYRVGADGEPAVGLSVNIVDLASGKVLWSASGARAGWGRDTVSGTAHALLTELLTELDVQ